MDGSIQEAKVACQAKMALIIAASSDNLDVVIFFVRKKRGC